MWRRKAETASGSDAISGTYLTKVINQHAARDALFTADDGTALVWALRHSDRRPDILRVSLAQSGAPRSGDPKAMFRDATRIGQIATAADGLPGQRAVLEEALSCFDQAAAIRLCDESLAQLARTSLSIPNARLAASS
jgi:pyruvate dehydrogenase (quinone)